MDATRLEYLLDCHVDEALLVGERCELEEMLLESAQARELFWTKILLHGLIRDCYEARSGQQYADSDNCHFTTTLEPAFAPLGGCPRITCGTAALGCAGSARTAEGGCPTNSKVILGRPLGVDRGADLRITVEPQAAAPINPPTLHVTGALGNAGQGVLGYCSEGWPQAYLIATVVTALGLWICSHIYMSPPEQVARQSDSLRAPLSPLPSVVGRITGMVDCKWVAGGGWRVAGAENPPSAIHHPPSLVSLGDKFMLASGLMEITYNTGAKVILQGPVTYEVGSNGGYLAVGKLTGKLEKRGERREERGEGAANHQIPNPKSQILNPSPLSPLLSPLFVIRTPTATVTDLGTEFGVEVREDRQSRLHVFQGKVVVRAQAPRAEAPHELEISEGESALVDTQGAVRRGAAAQTETTDQVVGFVRVIPKNIIKTLNLVDIVAGGDGFGTAHDCGIDPSTGKTASIQTDLKRSVGGLLPSDGRYHRVEQIPFVDGVFIPRGGKSPTQLDSAGHVFAKFPKTDSYSYGCIWAGGIIPHYCENGVNVGHISADSGFIDYSQPGHAVLSMHANKGITFDLAAVRRANPQSKIMRFRALAGNWAAPPAESQTCDVWVFVDGQLRFSREGMISQHPSSIEIKLGDQDRFLSLVSTDGGDGCSLDWVMFGDPQLILSVPLAL